MARIWYLCNGDNGTANTVCLLNQNGEIRNSFPDIAHLDLSTMNLALRDVRDTLKDYNYGVDLSHRFYNISRQTKDNGIVAYPTIFDLSSICKHSRIAYCMNYLKDFAEQRQFKFDRDLNIKLQDSKDLQLCIRKTFDDMDRLYYSELITYNSLLPERIKSLLMQYHRSGEYLDDFIDQHSILLYNHYSCYTTLRNILFELMTCTLKRDPVIGKRYQNRKNRSMYEDRNRWKVTDLEQGFNEQLQLFGNDEGFTRKRK